MTPSKLFDLLVSKWTGASCCCFLHSIGDSVQEKLGSMEELEPHPLESLCLPDNFNFLPSLNPSDWPWSHDKIVRSVHGWLYWSCTSSHKGRIASFHQSGFTWHPYSFSTPRQRDDPEDEPISLKKLKQGDGHWDTQKILGWLFDGLTKCMQLPPAKVSKICKNIFQITKRKMVWINRLEQLNGKLMHASIGISNRCGLLSPVIAAIATKGCSWNYKAIWLNEQWGKH